jgi:asparagine synthase (glutamine-hydrolysing)
MQEKIGKSMKDIFEQFRLDIPRVSCCDVVGISDLVGCSKIERSDIRNSRGEFAGYAVNADEVLLFRDRLGARNLYYYYDNKTKKLYIDTNLAHLAHTAGPMSQLNVGLLIGDYLPFQLPLSNDTFFRGIRKVMPGEIVHFTSSGIYREQYWEPKFGERPFKAAELRELIQDAVRFRLGLIGKNPCTTYLSGGLDSSTITLLTRLARCFTGFYQEENYSELDFVEAVLAKADYPLEYVRVPITEQAFKEMAKSLPDILPDPACGLGVIAQVLVAKAAAEAGYRYAFTGEGGDEIFLGYNWNYVVFALSNKIRELFKDRYMVRYEPMLAGILRDSMPPFVGGLLVRGRDATAAQRILKQQWDYDDSVENNILKINLLVGLPAILTVDEQVGRFTGVEPVSPFVDHNIVDYVCSVRSEDRASIPKYMLREATKDILPEKIRTRYNKMGFPVPFEKWDWTSILEPAMKSLKARDLIDFDLSQIKTMDRRTWALFSIERWLERYGT